MRAAAYGGARRRTLTLPNMVKRAYLCPMTPDVLTRARNSSDQHSAPSKPARTREVSLDDKYELAEGMVFMSGIHALVRTTLEQMRADRAAGLDTGTMVSGYQGSPLGGFDKELGRVRKQRDALRIEHRPALNEELGATTVWGSQLTTALPRPTADGVLGIWYGKAPGVDRAADALRHGNFVGAHPKGGLIALAGDDPSCKSSTLPSATESTLASLGMPVIYPGNVQEVLDLGRHAVAASRASGLWVGLKVVTNVADAVATAYVSPDRVKPQMPIVEWQGGPYVHQPSGSLLAPASLEMEQTLVGPRRELALAYARLNHLNPVTHDAPGAWLGVVAAGTAYYDLIEAFHTLGIAPEDVGVRILKLGMVWPLETEGLREFARGLEEILVVEEKGPFVETLVKDALYDCAERPRVTGERESWLDADKVARAVGARLRAHGIAKDSIEARLSLLDAIAPQGVEGAPARTPFFCSGCPHNRSTDAPDDATVGLGIGCHTMVLLNQKGKGKVAGLTQMGGEGTQWIGQAPFTDTKHIFQNLGDGTFHHSGSLAIRAAVASGVNITYKLLYNSTVAMTGGQDVEGVIGVPDLTRWLEIEGVRRIIVTTDEPERYKDVELASIAEVRPRIELIKAQKELSKVAGCTVLIHDQQCATEKRRLRKRGKLAEPKQRIAINERVCEGCGDCGEKSDCLSVLPVQTEFGRKTQIHQASCNKDFSCVEGDCPSFLEVIPGKAAKKVAPAAPADLPAPRLVVPEEDATLRFIGIGGTGVVTISQIVGMAALIDGKQTRGLDQTGLAQKGGPVVSDVRIFADAGERSNKAVTGGVHGYLGFDLLGAASPTNLMTADPKTTVAVVSTSQVPTGSMVIDTEVRFAEIDRSLDVIGRHTRGADNVYFDAQELSEQLFGDHMPTNTLLLGAAWQRGLIPLSLEAIEQAIRLNGAAVEKTLAAFHWGRATVAAPDAVAEATRVELPAVEIPAATREIVASVGAPAGSELERLLEVRVAELIAYQNARYAQRYADFVRSVLERELDGRTQVAEAVAVGLHKLMAYKDEYEVARLHLDPVERARIMAEFGDGAKIRYKLHPPVFRALGLQKKLSLGSWFDPAFRVLRRMKVLRGRKLDLFALPKVRRVERALPGEYRALVERALGSLEPRTYDGVVELCALPDVVRGYEDVKLRNVETFRSRAAELVERIEGDHATPLVIVHHG
jgi:indolepyruvate ferredoxin oxidoreductase